MKFYSETTKKLYDSAEELEKAELALTEKKKNREARAKEVEEVLTAAREAQEHAHKVLADFCKDYGSYHKTIKGLSDVDDWFSWLTSFIF